MKCAALTLGLILGLALASVVRADDRTQMLDQYLGASEAPTATAQNLAAIHKAELVLALRGLKDEGARRAAFEQIDALGIQHPQAIAELEYSLQVDWEKSELGSCYYQQRLGLARRKELPAEFFLNAVGGVASFRSSLAGSWTAGNYLLLASGAGGLALGELAQELPGEVKCSVPPVKYFSLTPTAALMPFDDVRAMQFRSEFVSNAAAVAAATAASKTAVRFAGTQVATKVPGWPGKAVGGAVVLGAGIIAGWVAQEFVHGIMRDVQEDWLKDQELMALGEWVTAQKESPSRDQPTWRVLAAERAWIEASVRRVLFKSLPVLEIQTDFVTRKAQMASQRAKKGRSRQMEQIDARFQSSMREYRQEHEGQVIRTQELARQLYRAGLETSRNGGFDSWIEESLGQWLAQDELLWEQVQASGTEGGK